MVKMKVQHPDGVHEYPVFGSYAEVEAALKANEIKTGDDIIYRGNIVHMLAEGQMLLVDILQMNPTISFNMGGFPNGQP